MTDKITKDTESWIIAKKSKDEIRVVIVVIGTKDDAENVATRFPSWYVAGRPEIGITDHR